MNISHLRYALEVEKTGSITQAAENLFMGQPNLSKAIKELENAVGIPIFQRNFRGVTPTQRGAEFLKKAKEIVERVDALEVFYAEKQTSPVRFSACGPRASYISHAFCAFVNELENYSEFSLDFRETNSAKTIEDVSEGRVNLGIVRYFKEQKEGFCHIMEEKGLKVDPLWKGQYVVLTSKNNPIANGEDYICEEMLEKGICIRHGDLETPFLRKKMEKQSKGWNKEILVYERGSQFDLLAAVPTTYMWVTPVPPQVLEMYGLMQKPCVKSSREIEDVIVYPEVYRFTKADSLFVDMLHQTAKKLEIWVKGKDA